MDLEEAIKILKNINVLNLEEYTEDEINQAIDIVLEEIEYLKKNQRYKKDFNGDKIFCLEYDKETLRDMVLEQQEEIKELKSNSISKDKIREKIKELQEKNKNTEEIEAVFNIKQMQILEELLREE